MRSKFLIYSLVFILTLSCKEQSESKVEMTEDQVESSMNNKSLKGTWELTGYYNYNDNKVVDSFDMNPDFRQIKMYTDTKVMWCKHMAADSSEWFGYGTYKIDGDMLMEVLDFGSEVMDEVIADRKEFMFELELHPNKFRQIELDDDGNKLYSENYARVE
ncbi:MAG: hypothetical protein HKN40_06340 [Winogradskyella sp.]|uniref:hypothetical protein n=1 Tax=Winogradskyella sp. TaxID=1883156 RepID=UPI0017BB48EB|nr:hypothetical protein [Winogradskyella sp.]